MNIGEIARRSGVSPSTVSYALSGKRAVSEATRQGIQAVIDELGYRPNAAARALGEGRTRTIGLVIPPARRQLTFMQLDFVAGVMDAATRAHLDMLLSPSGGDHDRSFERITTGHRVDGVILMEIRLDDPRVTRLQRLKLPFVTIGRTARPEGMSWIEVERSLESSERSCAPGWRSRAGSRPPGSPRGSGPSSSIPHSPRRTCPRRRWRLPPWTSSSSASPIRAPHPGSVCSSHLSLSPP